MKVCELTGEALQTPSPFTPCAGSEVYTPQAGTGGSSVGVLTSWREDVNADICRSSHETVGSLIDEPCPQTQGSYKLLAAFWYLPLFSTYIFIMEKVNI